MFDLTFFDGLDPEEFGPGAIAMIDRVHHALLDGMSGLEMVQVIFDPVGVPAIEVDLGDDHLEVRQPPSPLRLAADTLIDRMGDPVAVSREVARLITSPSRTRDLASRITASSANLFGHGLGASTLNASVGPRRRLLTLDVPLAQVHRIGSQLGGSVNDVLLAAVASGVGTVLRSRDEDPSGSLNVLVPVSTRQAGMDHEAGNQVAALVAELPLGENLGTTFELVHTRMQGLKQRGVARGSEAILDAGDLMPPTAIDAAARVARHQRWVNMVVTNIAGPPGPLALLGGEVRSLVPIVPLGANLTVGLAIVSYNGTLTLSFHADRDRWPDLDVMTEAVSQALDDLSALARASEAGEATPSQD